CVSVRRRCTSCLQLARCGTEHCAQLGDQCGRTGHLRCSQRDHGADLRRHSADTPSVWPGCWLRGHRRWLAVRCDQDAHYERRSGRVQRLFPLPASNGACRVTTRSLQRLPAELCAHWQLQRRALLRRRADAPSRVRQAEPSLATLTTCARSVDRPIGPASLPENQTANALVPRT
ncbi:MAG: hypothetical protein MHM6MM_006921, partial [Cercozoa sp. M6MM]